MRLLVLGLLFVSLYFAQARVSYHGFKMYEVIPKSKEHLEMLRRLHTESRIDKVDFWVPPRGINIPVQISVAPGNNIIGKFKLIGMETRLRMDNVQQFIDEQNKVNLKFKPKAKAAEFDYSVYHDLREINEWITNITTVYKNIAQVIEIGESFEARSIRLIKIDTGKVQEKSGFFMEGGIHAREWISPATVMYMTGQMLDKYGVDEKITDIVDSFTWYILPVFNVDGYEFTWTNDRMWRKTRSEHGLCRGTDPNRNWDYEWCEGGASKEPCSDTYCGPSAFSEVEVKAVSDYILQNKANMKAFIDFHSFSQLWMTPWGYTSELPPDYPQLDAGAKAAVDALGVDYGTKYEYGNIADIIYVASGSSADCAYGAADIKYSYAVELRDLGQYGFLLPANQIIPSGKETLEALKALCTYVYNN